MTFAHPANVIMVQPRVQPLPLFNATAARRFGSISFGPNRLGALR
jgi:hypothetical protein